MPTIYTDDPVGKAVEDHYYGTNGVWTGSVANQIGYDEYNRRQAARKSGVRGGGRSGRAGDPAAGLFVLIVLAAAIVGGVTESWAFAVATLLGVPACIWAVAAFFRTRIGKITAKVIGGAVALGGIGLIGSGIHAEFGLQGLLWAALVLTGAAILGALPAALRWFFATRLGRGVVRVVRVAVLATLAVGAAALVVAFVGSRLA